RCSPQRAAEPPARTLTRPGARTSTEHPSPEGTAMSVLPVKTTTIPPRTAPRRHVRRVAAVLAAAVAVIYCLIAAQVVTVIDGSPAEVAQTQLVFGTSATVAYLIGVVLLLRFDRPVLWLLGALLQLAVIGMYLNVSTERQPAFEVWGITI